MKNIYVKNYKGFTEEFKMYKGFFTLLIITLSLFTHPLVGQQSFYISSGINNSKIIFTNFDDYGWGQKRSIFIGLGYRYLRRENFEFSTEIQYSPKGSNISNGRTDSPKYFDFQNYINYTPKEPIKLSLGINLGFLFNESESVNDKILDLGVLGGLSIDIWKFEFYGIYNLGLLDTETKTPDLDDLGIKVLNRNLQIGIKYQFKGG